MDDLRTELLKLTNPTPVFKDPEDDSDDETRAKLVHNDDCDVDEITPSKLRQRTAVVLADIDKRYAGKKTSRQHITSDSDSENVSSSEDLSNGIEESNDENIEEDLDMNEDDTEDVDDKSANYKKKFRNHPEDDSELVSDDEEHDEDSTDSDASSNEQTGDNDDLCNIEDELEDDRIQNFSSATDELAKGEAARQQLGLWDKLLEGRIKLQKALCVINQLPQPDTWTEFYKSEAFAEEAVKTQLQLKQLLDNLIQLQQLLMLQNTVSKHVLDDDDINIGNTSSTASVKEDLGKRKHDMDDYPSLIKKRHESFQSLRNETIQKWFEKTRLATGRMRSKLFSAFDQSFLAQINQILADKERLVRRTQLKRSVYRVLGNVPKRSETEMIPTDNAEVHLKEREHLKDYDEEVFDDDDFYHQMLRELIAKKTADVTDPVAISRQWLEIQKMRSRNKKKVDTRASKGRKVRYDVHKKLVNFMAPIDDCQWSHEARDDLFKSLFGRRFAMTSSVGVI